MTIRLTTQNFSLGKRARAAIIGSLRSQLSELPNILTDARVSFRDVNGPRGGIDKECLIRVRLSKKGQLVTRAKGESLGKAFSSALDKLESALTKRLSKARKRKSCRMTRDKLLAEAAAA